MLDSPDSWDWDEKPRGKTKPILGVILGLGVFCLIIFAFLIGRASSRSTVQNETTDLPSTLETPVVRQPPTATVPGLNASPTPVVDSSPMPTQDPNPALSLPFQDNFDNGLDPNWRIVAGEPLILDGKLSPASAELRIEIGNSKLTTYTLEMDVWGEKPDLCGIGYGKHLKVNPAPKLRFQFFGFTFGGRLIWETYASSQWSEMARYDNLKCGRFKVVVANSSYSLSIQGDLVSEIISLPAEGPLSISMDDSITLDNLVIR